MAQITLSTDDVTGEQLPEGTPTTVIVVTDPRGPIAVEVDLSDTSFKALQKALDKIVSKGRPVDPPQDRKAGTDAQESKDARAWALAHPDLLPQGVTAKERGAVSAKVLAAYREHLANS